MIDLIISGLIAGDQAALSTGSARASAHTENTEGPDSGRRSENVS